MTRKGNKKRNQTTRPPAEKEEELAPGTRRDEESDEERFHFFWKSGSPFSQWHASKYELNGVTYSCAEQGMMHGKALLFEDYAIANEIMKTSSPRTMKALGRAVRGFKPRVWDQNRESIVYSNSVAKFTQNPHLLQSLMNTEGMLVEASPRDAIWGIGLAETDARNVSHKRWPGLNLLGKILTRVRDEIRAGFPDAGLCEATEEGASERRTVEERGN